MRSIDSSGRSAVPRTAARAAAEGAVIALLGAVLAGALWRERAVVVGARVGIAAAWAASSASVAWLLWARERSTKAFWYAFGGGMGLRAAVLGILAGWFWSRTDVSIAAVLVSYVFALLTMLLTLEFRHLKLTQTSVGTK